MNFKKCILHFSYTVYNVYVMFYQEIPWFYQDFKFVFLNMYSGHTVRILDLSLKVMLSPPKLGAKHLYNSKGFSFRLEQVQYFYFSEAKFINVFKM